MQMQHTVSRGHSRPLTEISFTLCDDKTLLMSSAHDKTPQVRHGETGDWIGSYLGHKGAVWSAKIDSRTQTLAVTGSGDFTAKLWCASTGRELHEFKHKHVVRTVDFSQDTLGFATGCQDGLIRVYDTCQPNSDPFILNAASRNSEQPNDATAIKIVWSRCSDHVIFVGTRNGRIQKWDTRIGGGMVSDVLLAKEGCGITDLEESVGHRKLSVACEKRVLILSGDDLSTEHAHTMPDSLTFKEEGGVSLSSDGSKFFAGGSDLWVREFDVTSGEVLRVFKGHHGPVRCIRYHPSGDMVASGSEDGTIRLWDLKHSALDSTTN